MVCGRWGCASPSQSGLDLRGSRPSQSEAERHQQRCGPSVGASAVRRLATLRAEGTELPKGFWPWRTGIVGRVLPKAGASSACGRHPAGGRERGWPIGSCGRRAAKQRRWSAGVGASRTSAAPLSHQRRGDRHQRPGPARRGSRHQREQVHRGQRRASTRCADHERSERPRCHACAGTAKQRRGACFSARRPSRRNRRPAWAARGRGASSSEPRQSAIEGTTGCAEGTEVTDGTEAARHRGRTLVGAWSRRWMWRPQGRLSAA